MSTTWTHQRAKLARLHQQLPADAPEIEDAKRALKATRLEDHIRKVLAEAPPLSDEQKSKIASLLRPAHGGAA